MALDVYFREDIANILRSVNLAGGSTAAIVRQEIEKAMCQGPPIGTANLADHLDTYQQGYRDALGAVAAAFGILSSRTPEVVPEMLVEQTAQTRADTQYIATAWHLKRKATI